MNKVFSSAFLSNSTVYFYPNTIAAVIKSFDELNQFAFSIITTLDAKMV